MTGDERTAQAELGLDGDATEMYQEAKRVLEERAKEEAKKKASRRRRPSPKPRCSTHRSGVAHHARGRRICASL